MDSGLKWLKSYTLWAGVLLGLMALATIGAKFTAPHFTEAPHEHWVTALNEFQSAYSQGLPWPVWDTNAQSGRGEPLLWGLAPLPYWTASLAFALRQLPSLTHAHWTIGYALSEGGLSAGIILMACMFSFMLSKGLSSWKRGLLTLLPWICIAWAVTNTTPALPLLTLSLGIAGATVALSCLLTHNKNSVVLCTALTTSLLSFGLTILPALGLLWGVSALTRIANQRTWNSLNIFNTLKALFLFFGVTSFYWVPLYVNSASAGVGFLSLNEQLSTLTMSSRAGLKLMLPAFALCAVFSATQLLLTSKLTKIESLIKSAPQFGHSALLVCSVNIIYILSTAHTQLATHPAPHENTPVVSATLKLEPTRPPLELVKGVTDVHCKWVSQIQVVCDAFAIRASTLRTRILAFPGWSARLDQSKTALKLPSDLTLSPGRHTINLQYKWQWHHILSLLTSLSFALFLSIQSVKQLFSRGEA